MKKIIQSNFMIGMDFYIDGSYRSVDANKKMLSFVVKEQQVINQLEYLVRMKIKNTFCAIIKKE